MDRLCPSELGCSIKVSVLNASIAKLHWLCHFVIKYSIFDFIVILEDYQILKDISASEIWVDRYFDEWIGRRSLGKHLGSQATRFSLYSEAYL